MKNSVSKYRGASICNIYLIKHRIYVLALYHSETCHSNKLLIFWAVECGADMPRRAKELSAVEVRRLTSGVHNVGGVAGLLMQVSDNGA